MARKKAVEEARGVPEWMVTYTDLVTLLFALFVLLFSLSTIDAAKFNVVSSALRSSFSVVNNSGMLFGNTGDSLVNITDKINANIDFPGQPPKEGSKEYAELLEGMVADLQRQAEELKLKLKEIGWESAGGGAGSGAGSGSGTGADGTGGGAGGTGGGASGDAGKGGAAGGEAGKGGAGGITAPDDKKLVEMTEEELILKEIRDARQQKLDNFEKDISAGIDRLGIGGYVSIVSQEERLVLRLSSQILFDSGSAKLRPEGRSVMLALGESFRELDHMIEVQGHTDNVPIRTVQFPSNWELSTQRATNVVRLLQDDCGVPPARLRSTGFGEYQPIGDNTTPEGRQSNRRIDIIVSTE